MIKNLIFDFGRVLIYYDYFELMLEIFENRADAESFYAIFHSKDLIERFDKGNEPFLAIVSDLREKYPRWDKQIQQFYDRMLEAMKGEVPGMRQIITRLKNKGYRVYGLTNWDETIYTIMKRYDILRLMDGILISWEEHLVKPDPAIYERLYEKFSLRADECLFTDDKQENVEGAQSTGMPAVLFKDATQYEHELVIRGIL